MAPWWRSLSAARLIVRKSGPILVGCEPLAGRPAPNRTMSLPLNFLAPDFAVAPQLTPEQMRDLAEGTRMVYLKADEQLPYSAVMKVMDLAREAGVEEVALIAERKVQG